MAKRIVTAIDVGTTKVATIVASVKAQDDIEILGVGVTPSTGLHKGVVVNMEQAKQSIAASVKEAQRISGMRVDSVFVGVTGRHITSLNNQGVIAIPRDDRMVRSNDLRRVLSAARSVPVPEGKQVLHAIPRQYTLDGQEGIRQPVGMHGSRLDVETHIITASITSIQNLVKCIRSISIDVEDLLLEPLASAEAVLTREERDTGVIMADIGGGTTDIAVFKGGSIYHTGVIPVAGYQVTSDLSIGLGLPFDIAEKMKKKFGNVTPALEIDGTAQVGLENGYVASCRNLYDVIHSRMEELLQLIIAEMPTTDYRSLAPCGLVLTGGTSNLLGLAELGETVLRIPARIGRPLNTGIYGISDILHDPAYATTLGLILWQAEGKKGTEIRVKKAGIRGALASLLNKLFRA